MMFWYEAPLAAFALRSTRTPLSRLPFDAENDRMTAAALVTQLAPGAPTASRGWQVESAPVPAWSVEEQARALAAQESSGTPLVVMNAPYDLTLLDRELRRLRGTRLADHLGRASLCVLDPLVLDKHLDRTRGGRRALPDLCAYYGVPLPPPDGDAESAARAGLEVVRALGRHHAPRLSCHSPAELHTLQAVWYGAQARGTAPWFASGRTERQVDPAWPLRPETPPAVA
ncbi:3'-5' exonuclease [Streptomyces sp. NPDC048172]|uniref:3'-5' exonuclease n=1 Tax=Streptomyces sp. NPDC048172 TaxID=3365505 RepID=UPI0037147634